MNNENKMYFYDSIAKHFDAVVNRYDTQKRLSVFFDELLPEDLSGKKVLDAGCGTGWFSQKAVERGATVTSMDIGAHLLEEVKKKCKSKRVVGSILEMPFKTNSFDIVVSSEVIEHVTEPLTAINEMYRVLKPGGILIFSTPNRFWHLSVQVANALHLRPYQGLENWQSFDQLEEHLAKLHVTIEYAKGIHLFPFVFRWTYPILDWAHSFGYPLRKYMVNMVFRARKAGKPKKKSIKIKNRQSKKLTKTYVTALKKNRPNRSKTKTKTRAK